MMSLAEIINSIGYSGITYEFYLELSFRHI